MPLFTIPSVSGYHGNTTSDICASYELYIICSNAYYAMNKHSVMLYVTTS